MIELTAGAQSRLNDYLAELRRVLQECPSVDPVDVERDVQDHIQAALAGADVPVDETHLDRVLRSLGVPRDWLQDVGLPWYRYPQQVGRDLRDLSAEFFRHFAAGPESFRLPYLSFAVLVFGAFLLPFSGHEEQTVLILLVAGCVSFVLARAALAFHDTRPSTAQLWILAPALLAVYVPLAGALLGWPIVVGGIATAVIENESTLNARIHREQEQANARLKTLEAEYDVAAARSDEQAMTELDRLRMEAKLEVEALTRRYGGVVQVASPPGWLRQVHPVWLAVFATTAVTGLWWLVLGFIAWQRTRWFHVLFRPFADGCRGRSGLFLGIIGLVLLSAGLFLTFG